MSVSLRPNPWFWRRPTLSRSIRCARWTICNRGGGTYSFVAKIAIVIYYQTRIGWHSTLGNHIIVHREYSKPQLGFNPPNPISLATDLAGLLLDLPGFDATCNQSTLLRLGGVEAFPCSLQLSRLTRFVQTKANIPAMPALSPSALLPGARFGAEAVQP